MLPNSQLRQILFLLLIAALFSVIFWNLKLFIPSLLGAYTLYVLLKRPLHYLTETRGWKLKLSVSILMLLSFFVILVPVYILVRMLSEKVRDGMQNSQQMVQSIQNTISSFESRIGMELLTDDRIKNISEWGAQQLSGALNATVVGFVMLLLTYIILWFMMNDGKAMETSFYNWLPLKKTNVEHLRKELNGLVYSNAIGIPVMGAVQGLAGLLGYWIAGMEDIWFWAFITFITSMVPFIGVAMAFIPVALILFSKGMTTQGIFIIVYGLAVIGTIDNLVRMWLLKKIGDTHPLITLFGVIIGLPLFGFIGFIFGPILIAMFLLLIEIYMKEFHVKTT